MRKTYELKTHNYQVCFIDGRVIRISRDETLEPLTNEVLGDRLMLITELNAVKFLEHKGCFRPLHTILAVKYDGFEVTSVVTIDQDESGHETINSD